MFCPTFLLVSFSCQSSGTIFRKRRKNWRLGKYFLGIKNNAELNRWTKKISDICGLSFYFSLPVKTLAACAAFNKEFALSLDGFFLGFLSKFFIAETRVSISMGINASNEHPYVPTCIRE